MNIIIEKEFGQNLIVEIHLINYRPSRPAPPCSNPDSPAYSDCGDDADYDDIKMFLKHKNFNEIHYSLFEKLPDEFIEWFFDENYGELIIQADENYYEED